MKPCSLKRKATREASEGEAEEPAWAPWGPALGPGVPQRLQHGLHSLPRASGSSGNEDAFVVAAMRWQGPSAASSAGQLGDSRAGAGWAHVLGVYDGHTSAAVSAACVEQLPQLLAAALTTQQRHAEAGASSSSSASEDAAVQQALRQSFEELDATLPPLSSNAGSTATLALLTPSSVHLAWVGDSRAAVLGANGRVLARTHDHRATREDEQERVTAAGGAVFNNSGMRVMGILATTRAIGDHDLRPYGVIPTPDVLSLPRTGAEEFVVLATDGLWDVFSVEEVYDYAHKTLLKVQQRHAAQPGGSGVCCGCQAAGIAARALAQAARKQRGSRDDITVLLVNLTAPCSCTRPLPAPSASSSAAALELADDEPVVHVLAAPGMVTTSSGSSTGNDTSAEQLLDCCLHGAPGSSARLQAAAGASAAGTQLQADKPPPLQQQQQQPQHAEPMGAPRPQPPPQPHAPSNLNPALMLQPSVCPPAGGRAAPARRGAPLSSSPFCAGEWAPLLDAAPPPAPLSDLALSSPFALMLGGALSEVEEPADSVAGPQQLPPASGSAPAGPAQGAAGSLVPAPSLRRRSLSLVMVSTRSCGAREPSVSSIGSGMGSAELPVVVLT